MAHGKHSKQYRKQDSSRETRVVVVERITSARRNISILIWNDGLDAGGKGNGNCLRGLSDMRVCHPGNRIVFGSHEIYIRRGSRGYCECIAEE